jgi:hypothetical protein
VEILNITNPVEEIRKVALAFNKALQSKNLQALIKQVLIKTLIQAPLHPQLRI